jgi:hypothetical protein
MKREVLWLAGLPIALAVIVCGWTLFVVRGGRKQDRRT